MVKQNKAKVSTNKWVFLLNVIASGMALDGYWSASSSAITAGMAIREACWILGKQAFSPLLCVDRAAIGLIKTFLSVLCRGQDNWNVSVIHRRRKHDCFSAGCDSRFIPWSILKFRTHLREQMVAWITWKGGERLFLCSPRINLYIFSCLLISYLNNIGPSKKSKVKLLS